MVAMQANLPVLVDYPLLTMITFLPLVGGLILLFMRGERLIRWTSLLTTAVTLTVALPLLTDFDKSTHHMQFVETHPWIAAWGIEYAVGVDGISVLFVVLAALLGVLCVAVSWRAIDTRVKEFFLALLIMETAMIGVFVSLNLFLFYLFWELMLIPMFLLIGVWGGPSRVYAAVKFVLFTLAGSVFMLVGIIVLAQTAGGTFDFRALAETTLPANLQLWLFFAFFAAFAVKVPMFPLHTWLPDAHTEAPTAGSVILAGILLKMGAYGFIRLSLPLFPDAVRSLLVPMLVLSVAAIIYGAYVTLTQSDVKRLIAYSSVSHMGFVTLGIFTVSRAGVEGGILQMINHGIVTGALFLCVGIIYERTHSREIEDYGGLSRLAPVFTTFFALFCLAAIGMPGTNTFIGEFLIISAAFRFGAIYGALAIVGVLLGVTYMCWLFFRLVLREVRPKMEETVFDLGPREVLLLAPLVVLVILIGVQPDLVLSYMHTSVEHLLGQIGAVGP
jgi:NADH-quinone oxidoreductase subunit M